MSEENKLSRRDLFANALMGVSLFAGLGLMASYVVRFLFPTVRVKSTRKLFVTTLDKIPAGKSFQFIDLKGQKINIVNTGEDFVALSTVCTHLGCKVHWKDKAQQFYCPCHDGYFDARGKVVKGPPPAPLSSYPVEVVDQAIYIHVDEVWTKNV